ncbi:hypothetical protein SDC9_155153 [bioreactor metagenome]|uniref:Uncharacterized protein n=1 Tax=bioreactor metagenome TaxID=1076179 RepID=A0A645F0S3_9ZZZZ
MQFFPVDESRFGLIPSNKQVLDPRHIPHQGKLLMNDRNPLRLRLTNAVVRKVDQFAVDQQLSAGHSVFARNALGQRGFAGSVFSDKAVAFARQQSEVYVVQRFHAGKLHRAVPYLDQRRIRRIVS